MNIEEFLSPRAVTQEEHWIPLADIMTVLMMMFLLIAVMFMTKVQAEADKIDRSALLYGQMRAELYQDLDHEFHTDLHRWHATIDPSLIVRFHEPDVLFATGHDKLKPQFAAILKDFFPRYIRILSQQKYRNSIAEIRIEGYTSSLWSGTTSPEDAYFLNMGLSQARTRSTLKYVLSLLAISSERDWLTAHLTANGFSSSKLLRKPDGAEDVEGSQRVEFRVRTDAEARISRMIEAAQR